jgi:hypothetical protein
MKLKKSLNAKDVKNNVQSWTAKDAKDGKENKKSRRQKKRKVKAVFFDGYCLYFLSALPSRPLR